MHLRNVSPKSKERRRIESREEHNYSLSFFLFKKKNTTISCSEAIECRRSLCRWRLLTHFFTSTSEPAHSQLRTTHSYSLRLVRGRGEREETVKSVSTSLLLFLDRNGFHFKYKIACNYYFLYQKLLGNAECQKVPNLSNVQKLLNSFSFGTFANKNGYEPSERMDTLFFIFLHKKYSSIQITICLSLQDGNSKSYAGY